jgi:L-cysteine desulfidase
VCDGAKSSCAAKIASSVEAAIMAFHMSMQNKSFLPGEGIIKGDIEETIKSMGYIGRVGMRATDTEILNVMIDRADVDRDC